MFLGVDVFLGGVLGVILLKSVLSLFGLNEGRICLDCRVLCLGLGG